MSAWLGIILGIIVLFILYWSMKHVFVGLYIAINRKKIMRKARLDLLNYIKDDFIPKHNDIVKVLNENEIIQNINNDRYFENITGFFDDLLLLCSNGSKCSVTQYDKVKP